MPLIRFIAVGRLHEFISKGLSRFEPSTRFRWTTISTFGRHVLVRALCLCLCLSVFHPRRVPKKIRQRNQMVRRGMWECGSSRRPHEEEHYTSSNQQKIQRKVHPPDRGASARGARPLPTARARVRGTEWDSSYQRLSAYLLFAVTWRVTL